MCTDIYTAHKRSLWRLCCYRCVCLSTGGGGGGACMAGGHVWWGRAWWGGHVWQGGMHGRYHEIRSMSGRYASYWNAFLLIDTPDNASHNQDHWLIRTPYLSMKANNDTPSVSVSMNTRPLETSQCLNLRPIHTDRKRKGEREFPLMFEFFPFLFAFVYCKWSLTAAFLPLSDRASLTMFWYSVSLSSSACVAKWWRLEENTWPET